MSGLHMRVSHLMRRSGAHVQLERSPGEGAEFEILFPRAAYGGWTSGSRRNSESRSGHPTVPAAPGTGDMNGRQHERRRQR